MASLSQTIPSLTGGISQQPDELKVPGQVKDMVNAYPDITEGLLKRPGGRLIKSLSDDGTASNNSVTNGKWFHYYRDETEQYIGQIARNGTVRVWRCSDGEPMYVEKLASQASDLTTYLTHTVDADVQTLTLNDYTYICNRTIATEMAGTLEPTRNPELFIDVKKIAYSRQYALNLYDDTALTTTYTATRVSVLRLVDSKNMCNNSDGGYPSNGTEPGTSGYQTLCDATAGEKRDSYCPNVGTAVVKITAGANEEHFGTNGDAINGVDLGNFAVNDASNSAVTDRKNLIVRIETLGQSVAEGLSNAPDYRCRYTTTHDLLYGGEGWRTGDYVNIWMHGAKYQIRVEEHSSTQVQCTMNSSNGSGLIRPDPTPFESNTTITMSAILGDIRQTIIDQNNGLTASNIEQIGNGLYITRSSGSFNANSPTGDLLNVVSDSIQDVADLPKQCKHGYVVKVKNSEANEDDYYLKFFGNNDRDGEGTWEECAKPGRKIAFNAAKMPLQMIRQGSTVADGSGNTHANGWFQIKQVDYENCLVGDPVTNPKPSFISTVSGTDEDDVTATRYINKMLFWRNRLAFLSDENVVLSQPGEFFNFWAKSAITFSPTDCIDLSCSSEYPAIIYDGIQTNSGLVLFTKNQQFLLTTDSDVLSPQTAKINSLATYNFNFGTNPISLGTTIAFLDNAGKYTRFWEMARILREGEPDVVEQSKVVPKLFNKDIDLISNSRENSIIFFSEKGKNILYGYKYFASSDKRLLQAWFKWETTGNVQYHCMLDDALYAVLRDNDKDVLVKYAMKLDDTGHFVTDHNNTFSDTSDDIIHNVHLDNSKVISASSLGYSSETGRTGFTKPDGFNSSNQLAVFVHTSSPNGNQDNIGLYAKASIVGTNIEWDGDFTGNDLIVGYLYDMEVELPTLYVTQRAGDGSNADVHNSLTLHRLKISLGPVGTYDTSLERSGKSTYTQTHEGKLTNQYLVSRIPIQPDDLQTIPIYEKNTNVGIKIKSTHPTPATIYSVTWEGDSNRKYYQRV